MSSLDDFVSELEGQELLSEEQKQTLEKARILKLNPDDMNVSLTRREREWLNDKELDFVIEYHALKRFGLSNDDILIAWAKGENDYSVVRSCIITLYETKYKGRFTKGGMSENDDGDENKCIYVASSTNSYNKYDKKNRCFVNGNKYVVLTLVKYSSEYYVKEFLAITKIPIDLCLLFNIGIILENERGYKEDNPFVSYFQSQFMPECKDEEKAKILLDSLIDEIGDWNGKICFTLSFAIRILGKTREGLKCIFSIVNSGKRNKRGDRITMAQIQILYKAITHLQTAVQDDELRLYLVFQL